MAYNGNSYVPYGIGLSPYGVGMIPYGIQAPSYGIQVTPFGFSMNPHMNPIQTHSHNYGNVRHTTIDIHGSGMSGQQTFVNGSLVNSSINTRRAEIVSSTKEHLGNDRMIKTVRWSDGTYEIFSGYRNSSGEFISTGQTHYR